MSAANPVETLPPRDATLFKSTLKFYENKQYKRGLKVCEQLLKKRPGHGESLAMKGLFLANLNRKEEGYEHVRLALKTCLQSHVCWHVYGLLYRADKNYEEAMKCYRNALRFDKDNFQILRDLAVLQLQLRQYPALCESRYQLLGLRPVVKINWISLAIAYHLGGKCDLAVGVLDAILDGFPEEPGNRFFELEQAELIFYKAMILEEIGQSEAALKCLDGLPERRKDQMAVLVKRARLLARLGRLQESMELWSALFESNPDDREVLTGLLRSTGANPIYSTLKELYAKYPKSFLLSEELVINSPMEHFGDTLRLVVLPAIRKGALGFLKPLKRFYADPARCEVLKEFFGSLSIVAVDQTSRSWTLIALANHLSLSGQHAQAVEVMEGLAREIPDVPDVLMYYARTLKRSGDLEKAAWAMDEARQMDLSDRFLNSKAVKYYLRGGMISKAQDLAVIFVKKGDLRTQLQDLVDMQVFWYARELADAYQRKGNHELALKYYRQIVNHFRDFIDDQFDFHNYVLRRYTFESYIKLLRYEDVLLGHELYNAAILAACRSARALAENAPTSIEERLAKASLEASPLQEVSLWLDGVLRLRRYDDALLSTAANVYAALGMTVKALRCLFHHSFAGKINHVAILQGVPPSLTDEIDRDVLVSMQPRLP